MSSHALDGDAGFAARSFLRSGGLTADEVRRRPVIGLCTSVSGLNPCNAPLVEHATAVREGIAAEGGLALDFPTISLGEALVRPTSMMLRNLMSMDVEEMVRASPIDGVVLLNGCDKTVAAQLLGAISAGRPALSLGAGHRAAGSHRGQRLCIDDSWRLSDERRSGLHDDETWEELEGCLSPSPGVCNVLGTAVSLQVVAEVLGFALPGSALLPAGSADRRASAEQTGRLIVQRVRDGITPDRHVTSDSLVDAWRVVCALGGSTNVAIHLLAIAGRAGVPLTLSQLGDVARTTPSHAQVRPNGPFELEDLHVAGGVAAVLQRLSRGSGLTATGERWDDREADPDAPVLKGRDDPAVVVLSGSLAPRGAVLKRSAATPSLLRHTGPAVVFEGTQDLAARIDDPDLHVTGDSVLVLRQAGPVGGPGMPEAGAIPVPRALLAQGITDVVRVSDARMSGTAAGTVVLHVAPEAAVGGPLALVRDGDLIRLDVDAGILDLLVPDEELERRRTGWQPPPPPSRGYARLHHDHVLQADQGCDFDFLVEEPV